jgi:hypothetical protein
MDGGARPPVKAGLPDQRQAYKNRNGMYGEKAALWA